MRSIAVRDRSAPRIEADADRACNPATAPACSGRLPVLGSAPGTTGVGEAGCTGAVVGDDVGTGTVAVAVGGGVAVAVEVGASAGAMIRATLCAVTLVYRARAMRSPVRTTTTRW